MSSTTKTPRAAPRDRSGPAAQLTAKGQARANRGQNVLASKQNPWTRVQDAKLLNAWHGDKTGQALADAVGDGRSASECTERLEKLVPKPVTRQSRLAYAWDPANPQKHAAVFRAALTEEERNTSEQQLKKLWMEQSNATCEQATKCVLNCLGADWNASRDIMAEKLAKMGLHPAFLSRFGSRGRGPPPRLTTSFSKKKQTLFATADAMKRHREHCMLVLSGGKKVNLADLNDDDFEKKDKRAYDRLRSRAAFADVLADDADVETQMPTRAEIPEISQRTVNPPFEPVPVDARLSNPAFARQFRRHDQSFDLSTGRSGCTCPSRAPPTRPERPESSPRHYVATICKHRPVLRHLLLPLFAQGRPRLRRALQEEEASAVHPRRLSCL